MHLTPAVLTLALAATTAALPALDRQLQDFNRCFNQQARQLSGCGDRDNVAAQGQDQGMARSHMNLHDSLAQAGGHGEQAATQPIPGTNLHKRDLGAGLSMVGKGAPHAILMPSQAKENILHGHGKRDQQRSNMGNDAMSMDAGAVPMAEDRDSHPLRMEMVQNDHNGPAPIQMRDSNIQGLGMDGERHQDLQFLRLREMMKAGTKDSVDRDDVRVSSHLGTMEKRPLACRGNRCSEVQKSGLDGQM